MDRKRLLIWLLRLAGTIEILAFVAVVMPRAWMEGAHAWLGLGVFESGLRVARARPRVDPPQRHAVRGDRAGPVAIERSFKAA